MNTVNQVRDTKNEDFEHLRNIYYVIEIRNKITVPMYKSEGQTPFAHFDFQ